MSNTNTKEVSKLDKLKEDFVLTDSLKDVIFEVFEINFLDTPRHYVCKIDTSLGDLAISLHGIVMFGISSLDYDKPELRLKVANAPKIGFFGILTDNRGEVLPNFEIKISSLKLPVEAIVTGTSFSELISNLKSWFKDNQDMLREFCI